jgi:hypothetical protein
MRSSVEGIILAQLIVHKLAIVNTVMDLRFNIRWGFLDWLLPSRKDNDAQWIFVIGLVHKESSLKIQGPYTAEYSDAVLSHPTS